MGGLTGGVRPFTPPPTPPPVNPYSGCGGSSFNPLEGAGLPFCTPGTQPKFNSTSCLASCKPCGLAQMLQVHPSVQLYFCFCCTGNSYVFPRPRFVQWPQCIALSSIPPLCTGAQTFDNGNLCCPTCILAQQQQGCSKSNYDAAPICAAGVIPTLSATTGCPSCRPSNGLDGTNLINPAIRII